MATNQQLLEGLWGLGISQHDLARIGTKGTQTSFKKRLKDAGFSDDQIDTAQRVVDFRADDKNTPLGKVLATLQQYGQGTYNQVVERAKVMSGGKEPTNPEVWLQAVKLEMGDQVVSQLRIKSGLGPKPEEWNPFRSDAPKSPDAAALSKFRAGERASGAPPGEQKTDSPPGGGAPPSGAAPPPGGNPNVPALPLPDLNDPEAVRGLIASRYGGFDVLLDIPEIASIMDKVSRGDITAEEAGRLWKSSNYYKTTTEAERTWKIHEQTDPMDAAKKLHDQDGIIKNLFKEAGFTPGQERIDKLVDLSVRYGWSDADVKKFIAGEIKYDPDNVKGGTLGAIKDMSKEWLVPLSEQTMSTWAQGIVSGELTPEEFQAYLREQAKSMFPALGVALDNKEMTVKKYLDPYAEDTARVLGINPADIDWNDPKWMRAVNQVDPKTGQRTVMNRADWMTTLMTDPTYEYDKSATGIQAKQTFTNGLMASFGINL